MRKILVEDRNAPNISTSPPRPNQRRRAAIRRRRGRSPQRCGRCRELYARSGSRPQRFAGLRWITAISSAALSDAKGLQRNVNAASPQILRVASSNAHLQMTFRRRSGWHWPRC